MVINGISVYPGHPCPHSTGSGCNDYEHRPVDPCHNFYCGWVIPNSPLPEWMKPNNGKVIVLFSKLAWNGVPVDLAVPMGKKIPPRSLEWLKKFSKENARPLIYSEQLIENNEFQKQQQIHAYGPPAFQEDMMRKMREEGKLW